ncbi:MAG: FRG domain-containing protein [Phycisphaerae bacterium]|jgi:hypothetical protein
MGNAVYQLKRMKSWSSYLKFIGDYVTQDATTRQRVYFRGHADAKWQLRATVDRVSVFKDRHARELNVIGALGVFRSEACAINDTLADMDNDPLEQLARHHGFPTRLLDWTQSPYVAAFFAFDELRLFEKKKRPKHVAIWVLSAQGISDDVLDDVEIVSASFVGNRRAYSQRSVFTRLKSNDRDLEIIVPEALTKVVLPSSLYLSVMTHLDEMNINSAAMFPDLDGVARAVARRRFEFT